MGEIAEIKSVKLTIAGALVEKKFIEPTGQDQIDWFDYIDGMNSKKDKDGKSVPVKNIDMINQQNTLLAKTIGVSEEEVLKVTLIDRKRVLDAIHARIFSFLPTELMESLRSLPSSQERT